MSDRNHEIAEALAEYRVELSQTHLAEIIAPHKTWQHANEVLSQLTGIRRFFESEHEFQEFQQLIVLPTEKQELPLQREWGDFQTPSTLAHQVCQYLAQVGVAPSLILEPTFGKGNFILAALDTFPTTELVYGVEVQEKYRWHLKIALLSRALLGWRNSAQIELCRDNIFTHEFPRKLTEAENLLIIGNPPWVTNAELGALGSDNLPRKQNVKSLNGLDALTGKSNFDLGEFIILRLLDALALSKGTLAMLCKNATARNIVAVLEQKQFKLANIRTLEIDANREFGVAVDACLLVMDLGVSAPEFTCRVSTLDNPQQITRRFGWVAGKFVSDMADYESTASLDGRSIWIWRQGLKHDCASVMELEKEGQTLVNGLGETVDAEPEYLYGLLKGSDLKGFESSTPRKRVIVTQTRLGEDTTVIKSKAPKLWKYLVRHSQYLEQRKSSIYRDKPPFSIFGVGEYTFKPYKVAISGLYKEPNFSLVCPFEERPVMLDDTCYFLGFDSYREALFVASLFNNQRVKRFLHAIAFADAKRPFTKEVLMRVNVVQAMSGLSFQSLADFWAKINYFPRVQVTELDWEKFKENISNSDQPAGVVQLTLKI